MTYFVTSDTHFGHRNIIKFCNRPFADTVDMEICMIDRWNKVVGVTDTVFVLGDFSFASKTKTQEILMRLNGFKVFIWGNHDRGREKSILAVPGVLEGMDALHKNFNGKSVIMTHYPFESFREDFHFHGHTHGVSNPKAGRIDVGVDANPQYQYAPIPLDSMMMDVVERDHSLNLKRTMY